MRLFVPSRRILALALTASTLAACGGATPVVTRIDPNTAVDLSGDWNDADSKLVADEMIKDALSKPWITRYMQAHQGKSPMVIISRVANLSSEHINTRTFVQDIGGAFVNSGSVDVRYDGAEREDTRAELEDQQKYATADTKAKARSETGADFRLLGEINLIPDQEGGATVKAYQVVMRMTNVQTQQVVWQGKKEIKKVVNRSRFRS